MIDVGDSDARVDLVLVEVGDLREHRVELAGLFADRTIWPTIGGKTGSSTSGTLIGDAFVHAFARMDRAPPRPPSSRQ